MKVSSDQHPAVGQRTGSGFTIVVVVVVACLVLLPIDLLGAVHSSVAAHDMWCQA